MAKRWTPFAALLIAMASIQVGAAIAKSLFPVIGPQGAISLRLVFGALTLVLVMRPWRNWRWRRPWGPLFGYGVSLGGMNFFFYMSLQTVPLGVAVALEFTGPMLVAVVSSHKRTDLIWVGLALAGLILVSPLSGLAGVDLLGAAYALIAGGFWALYIVFGQHAGDEHGGNAVALGAVIAALVAAPPGVIHMGPELFAWALIPLGLAIALLSTVIPYSLEMFALTRIPRGAFGVFMSCEPAIAAASGAVILHEWPTINQAIAIVLIMAASAGVAVSTTRTPPSQPQRDPPPVA